MSSQVKPFKAARKSFGTVDATAVGVLLSAAADITLILDGAGVIRDMAISSDSLAEQLGGAPDWVGRSWVDQVMLDSKPKVEALLQNSRPDAPTRWRHVNHPGHTEGSVPVLYTTLGLGRSPRCTSAWWTRSNPWSGTTPGCAAPRRATACCSRCPPRRW